MRQLFLSLITTSIFANFSAQDITAAKYLTELERKVANNKVDRIFISTVKSAISTSETFSRYRESLITIEQIAAGKIKSCSSLNDSLKFIGSNSIHKTIVNFCHNKNLSNLYQLSEQGIADNLEATIIHFLRNNPSRLTDFVISRKSKDQQLAKVLHTITEISLKEDIILPQRLLNYIDLNDKITEVFQRNIPLSDKNKVIITKEFARLAKGIKDAKDKFDATKKLVRFHQKNQNFIYPKTAWKSLVLAGQNLRDENNLSSAEVLLNYSIDVGYDFETRNESIFYSLWLKIFQKKYSEALKIISDKKLIEQYSTLSSRVKFWIAYALYNEADFSISNHLFDQLIKSNPLNYYAIISQSFIPNASNLIKERVLNPITNVPKITLNDLSESEKFNFKELLIWGHLSYTSKTDSLLTHFVAQTPSSLLKNKASFSNYTEDEISSGIYELFLTQFNGSKSFLTSFKFMSRLIDKEEFNIKCINIKNLFPTDYYNIVQKVSGDIDPLLILSIIRQESAFNTHARSSVGATGLMQLMPATAKSLTKKFHPSDLLDPKKNITFGSNYFTKLVNRFDGDIILALSSYNAGPTKVSRWKKDALANLDPFFMIEEIPYKETRLYVKLIYRNFFYYNLLLKNAAPTTAKHSFKIVDSSIR